MLELKLKEQQQEKEKSVSAATAALTCSKEELEAYRKQCSEMKNKLGMAYQEVSTDHTPRMVGLGVCFPNLKAQAPVLKPAMTYLPYLLV